MDGVLVIDKPAGLTSHDVVAVVRRILHEKRIGHTGTLDPLATGVLPLVIGRATRLASLLSGSDKQYEAGVRLGRATATYDAAERLAAGEPSPPPPDVALDEIEAVLRDFRGDIQQVPPPYSAKKVGGVRAYALARADRPPELRAVPVTVRALEALGLAGGLLTVRVTATAGFYVRSLAHDIGARLGCGAHLESLRRTSAAGFGLEACVQLQDLAADPGLAERRLVPMGALARELPSVVLTEAGRIRASHGNALSREDVGPGADGLLPSPGDRVRLLASDGTLAGIALAGPDGLLRPSIVLV